MRMITGRRRLRAGSPATAVAAALVAGALAPGCGAESEVYPGAGAAPIIVPEAEEVFRIGSVSGDDWAAFSRVIALGFDGEGRLHVLDGSTRSVTVVDAAGRLVRTIGRGGDGPGELRMPTGMAVLDDGRVVIADPGQRGLQVFDPNGEYLRTVPVGEGVAATGRLLPHGDDAVVYGARAMMMGGMGGGPAQPADVPVQRSRVEGGTGPEVLHRAWLPPREAPQVSSGGGMTMVRRAVRAFDPQLHLAVLPGGAVAVADTTTYRIRIIRPGQDAFGTIEGPVAPAPVTDRERERERTRRLAELEAGASQPGTMMGAGGGRAMSPSQSRAMLEAQLESMVFWPEISVIQHLAADRDGRLWVHRFGDVGEPGPIDLLRSDGTLLGVVPAGTMEIPLAFGPDGLAAWVELDELDVPFVRVARLTNLP
jgi:hypothetical protein